MWRKAATVHKGWKSCVDVRGNSKCEDGVGVLSGCGE